MALGENARGCDGPFCYTDTKYPLASSFAIDFFLHAREVCCSYEFDAMGMIKSAKAAYPPSWKQVRHLETPFAHQKSARRHPREKRMAATVNQILPDAPAIF